MTSYLDIGLGGAGGSPYFGDPVPNFASLPGSGLLGELRITLDTGVLYYWDGAAWNVPETEVASVAHANTDGIDITTPGSILTASLNISADTAQAGFYKATTTLKSGANKGLHVELEESATGQTGVLTGADWDTFNGKEPPISAGTTAQFWRGDKSFQNLDVDAMQVLGTGTVNASTKLLGIDSASAVPGAVAATGVWGSQVSLALAAGTYMAWGVAVFSDALAVLTNEQYFGISTTANASSIGAYDYIKVGGMFSSENKTYQYALPQIIVGDSNPITLYLNAKLEYSSGAPLVGGKIIAMRIR